MNDTPDDRRDGEDRREPGVPQHPEAVSSGTDPDRVLAPQPLKHSGLGIASFLIAVTMLAAMIASFAAIIGLTADMFVGNEWPDEQAVLDKSPIIVLFAFFIVGALLLDLVGATLGIVSLFQKNRRKLFGILGTVLSLLPLAGFALLFLLGLALSGQI